MNCKKCGFLLTNQNKTCPNCGELNELYVEGTVQSTEPVQPAQPVQPVQPVQPEVQQTVEPLPIPNNVEAATTTTVETPQTAAPVAQPIAAAPITAVPAKKNSNIAFIIITIVLSLAIVGLGVFICIKLFGGDGKVKTKSPSASNTPTEPSTPSEPTTPSEPSTPTTPVSNTDTFEIDGFTFTIPDGYKYLDEDGLKGVQGTGYKFAINEIVYESYDEAVLEVKAELDDSNEIMEENGFIYLKTGETTVDGKNIFYQEYNEPESNTNVSILLIEIDNDYTLVGALAYYPSTLDQALKTTISITKTAKSGSRATKKATKNIDFTIKKPITIE